ncbi:DUF5994 family protein [Nucisporomicrobium flavum]|uniref:DUF5994 family protein n=1 Tax=Nucisporomicrobium flavum TaxID=2785915 RepID=UPI0018F32D46|nr:DUF5994 family protein [Nucisporomicrobium flavum]
MRTTTSTSRVPDDAVRLRMDPVPSRTTVLDGAWWPRSTDVVAELPALVDALPISAARSPTCC